MRQLELFDEQSEEDFAMSLTNTQLYDLRKSNPEAHHWIKQIRMAIQEYNARCRSIKAALARDLDLARTGRGKGHYQLDRYPGW